MRKTTGLSLLLLIFLSLCLIIFSLLSLSGATADETLSQKTATRTKEYYAAVSEVNQILAEIDALLAEELRTVENNEVQKNIMPFPKPTDKTDIYLQNCVRSLETRFPNCAAFTDTGINMTFSVSVTDTQHLQVSLLMKYPLFPEDTLYQIIGWEVINTDTWSPDLSQNIYIP